MKKLLAFMLSFLMVFQLSITAFAFKDTTNNIFTGKKYTHDDRFKDYEIVNGLDISYYQKNVDFEKLKAAGVDFLFLRAGFRGYGSKGTLNKDTTFDAYAKGAIEAGIDVGVYFYSQAITVKEAQEEADYTMSIIKDYDITMPVMFDFEYANGGRLEKAKLSNSAHTEICLAYCQRVENEGYTSGVYANHSMLLNDLNDEEIAKDYMIWLANYNTAPKYNSKLYEQEYSYWQYTSSGSVDGIDGRVDCNFRYFKAPQKVVNLQIDTNDYQQPVLTWDRVKDCYGYEIYKLDKDTKQYVKIGTNKGAAICTYTDTADKGESNSYKVKAISRNKGEFVGGEMSDEVKSQGIFKMTMQSNGTGYATFTWRVVPGASEYQVLRADTENGTYDYVATLNSETTHFTDYTDDGFKTYFYMVRAVMRDSEGVLTDNIYTPCLKAEKPQPVLENVALTENNAIVVNFTAMPYATGTEIWAASGTAAFKKVGTVLGDTNSYTHSKLKRGVKYQYKVRQYIVKDGKTYYSEFSNVEDETTLKTTTITLTTTKAAAKIVCEKVTGANGYEIYMKAPTSKTYKKQVATKKQKYTKKGLKSGKTYKFKVRTYRVVDGKTIYSPYSKTKKIKIK